jgi:transcriptional regulator with XRE-family HTH domain
MGSLLSLILPRRLKFSKRYSPNPTIEYRIVFKKGALAAIKIAKGWHTDAEMARALGVTRSYINMLKKTRVSVTATVITRLAAQLSNIGQNWWLPFEIVPWGVIDQNHPIYNQEKYMGQIPYNKFSLSADFRRKDYRAEKCD